MPGACPNIANTGGADLTHKKTGWRWAAIFIVYGYALHMTLVNSRRSVYEVEFLPRTIYVPELDILMMMIIII